MRRYFRFTFSDSKRVAGLLREFLPEELVACLDLDHIKRIHENQVRDSLRESRDDLNMECPMIPSGTVLIRILVEHKSDHAPELWLQLMRSICTEWEQRGFRPIIPVVLHTGPEQFRFETPQHIFSIFPSALVKTFPSLHIFPIDLSQCPETMIWDCRHLDHVSKVGLSILRLAQQNTLDISNIRNMLSKEWPGVNKPRQNRYIQAAISYLRYKSESARQLLQELDTDMAFVHSINPNSLFAQELREEFAKGESVGMEKGIEIGTEQEAHKHDLERIEMIERMLVKGNGWDFIQEITHIDQATFEALKKKQTHPVIPA